MVRVVEEIPDPAGESFRVGCHSLFVLRHNEWCADAPDRWWSLLAIERGKVLEANCCAGASSSLSCHLFKAGCEVGQIVSMCPRGGDGSATPDCDCGLREEALVTKSVLVSGASLQLPAITTPTTLISFPRTSTLLRALADLRFEESATEKAFGYSAQLGFRTPGS